MATPDPRHSRRQALVQELFAASFNGGQMLGPSAKRVWDEKATIDPLIEQTAPEWPLNKLNRIDLAILRLAVFELVVDKTAPVRVIIDEAVELAKDLGGESSPAFVNGVLGTIVKEKNLEQK